MEKILFESSNEDLSIEKFPDGSVSFEIFHRLGSNYFILEKDQVETLIKWLNEKVII